MKILMISGSRNREGRTAGAMGAIGKGIEKSGGSSEVIFLTEQNIERCRQCESDGWGKCRSEKRCIIEDDFASIVEKIRAADAVVFANPVYFGDLSESMRAFLDRLRRTSRRAGPPQGPAARPAPGAAPSPVATPAIGICLSGGGGGMRRCAA